MLVIFDLDGVLIDSKEIHYNTLNSALAHYGVTINREEQETTYNGLPTMTKLKLLSKTKGLPTDSYETIWKLKQDQTVHEYDRLIKVSLELIAFIIKLRQKGYKVAVASNSIRYTINIALTKLGIIEYIDYFVGNDEITHPKPHPEIFWKCMTFFNTTPAETIIVEDSPVGRAAAYSSGAKVFPVENVEDFMARKEEILSL